MVRENDSGGPGQEFSVGVTIIFPVTGEPEMFCGAIQGGILPEPGEASPIAVLELVQEKEAPGGLLTKA
jgi:hypothetical protein